MKGAQLSQGRCIALLDPAMPSRMMRMLQFATGLNHNQRRFATLGRATGRCAKLLQHVARALASSLQWAPQQGHQRVQQPCFALACDEALAGCLNNKTQCVGHGFARY